MRNYARFQVKIDVSRVISVVKDLTCLVRNSSKSSMHNDMFDFNVLKFFDIYTCSSKVLLDESFLHQVRLKLTLMMLLEVLLVLLLVEVFSVREFICGFYTFLDVQTIL